jgi:hypothetical protein
VLEAAVKDLGEIARAETQLEAQLIAIAERKLEAEVAVRYLRRQIDFLPHLGNPVSGNARSAPRVQPPEKVGIALRSAHGQTRYELALAMITTSDRPITSNALAQAFEGVAKPARGRVEGARQTLLKLTKDGYASRLQSGAFTVATEKQSGSALAMQQGVLQER